MWSYKTQDELYHYSVLGMKWGKRKSVNTGYNPKKNVHKGGVII